MNPLLAYIKKWFIKQDYSERAKIVKLLNALYADIDAYHFSKQDRQRLGLDDDNFIYGEVHFLSFLNILERVKPRSGDIFYDLGSGSGRAVIAAALAFDFSKSCGIEILPTLIDLANNQVTKAKSLIKLEQADSAEHYLQKIANVMFINDDFLHVDIDDADIIFITATCFHYTMWQEIVLKLATLKPGARVIVGTKKIEHEQFELVDQCIEPMSWGISSIHTYIKRG
jgi:SAM-dependent methyltransferase